MGSPDRQKREQHDQASSTLGDLVQSVLERDILFVLYHLKGLESAGDLSLNQQEPSTRLTPLQAALSLSPADCPRRRLIHQILLLSGAVESQRASDSDPVHLLNHRAARKQDNKDRATASKLLFDLSIEEAEGWLWENNLGVEEGDVVRDSDLALPPPPSTLKDNGGVDDAPQIPDPPSIALPPSPPQSINSSATPEPRPSSFPTRRATPPRLPASSSSSPPAPSHQKAAALPTPTSSQFYVDHLSPCTTSVDLKRLLVRSIRHTLIQKIESVYLDRKPAFRVTLSQPVELSLLKTFDGAELDRSRIGVSFRGPSTLTAPRATLPSAPHHQEARITSASRSRSRSPLPRRPSYSLATAEADPRPSRFLPPAPARVQCTYQCPMSKNPKLSKAWVTRQAAPPIKASQLDLDRWAEESFEGRWPADAVAVPPEWIQDTQVMTSTWRTSRCRYFPPTPGSAVCYGRSCVFAHDQAELRSSEGSLIDGKLASKFAEGRRRTLSATQRPTPSSSIDPRSIRRPITPATPPVTEEAQLSTPVKLGGRSST